MPLWLTLPHHAGVWLNVLLEIYLAYVIVLFYLQSVGIERVVIVGLASDMYLALAQHFLPILSIPIQYLRVMALLAAFIASIMLLIIKRPDVPEGEPMLRSDVDEGR